MGAREKKRILVADDTLPLRIMLKDVLTEAGHEIVTASDGAKTWKIIEDEGDSFDLLILDLLMPEVTGFEILERLQKSPKKTKVIVITGIFKSGKEIQRLKDLGACGYITKTALVDEILFRVNQVFYMGQENSRSHPRLFMSIPVLYKIGEEQFSNYTSNFSGGGAFIRTIDPAPLQERININFQVPSRKLAVETECRVVWNNEYDTQSKKSSLPGMGVEFVDLSSSLQNSLSQFIQEKLLDESVWF